MQAWFWTIFIYHNKIKVDKNMHEVSIGRLNSKKQAILQLYNNKMFLVKFLLSLVHDFVLINHLLYKN